MRRRWCCCSHSRPSVLPRLMRDLRLLSRLLLLLSRLLLLLPRLLLTMPEHKRGHVGRWRSWRRDRQR